MPTPAPLLRAGCVRQPSGTPATWTLGPGQSEWLQLPRGAQVCVHEGRLSLHEPAVWLAESLWQPVLALHAGEVHRLPRPGRLRLEGLAPCVVSVLQPASLGQWLRAAEGRVLHRLRGWGRRWPRVAENS